MCLAKINKYWNRSTTKIRKNGKRNKISIDGNETIEGNIGEKEKKSEQIINVKDIKLKHWSVRREQMVCASNWLGDLSRLNILEIEYNRFRHHMTK